MSSLKLVRWRNIPITLTIQLPLSCAVPLPLFGGDNRLAALEFALWHATDHYGQLVEYLRMNGIVPPASRGKPTTKGTS